MTHVLDNPIWNALISGNQKFSFGTENAKAFNRDIAAFVGLKNNLGNELDELYDLMPFNAPVILFTPHEIEVSNRWQINVKRSLLQMVFDRDEVTKLEPTGLTPLTDEHIEAMLTLTEQTKPGPFFQRTIDFGNYMGIFDQKRLVSMVGQRLQPDPYTEISAVCTDPEYLGKGYAAKLIIDQINKIKEASRIPFLHLFSDNMPAYNLYKKLGFRARKEMVVYRVEKRGN